MSVLNLNGQDEPRVQTFEEIEKDRDATRRKVILITCAVLLIAAWLLAMLLWYLWNSRPQLPSPPVEQTQDVTTEEVTTDPPPEQVEEKEPPKEPDAVIALTSGTVELRSEPTQRPEGDVMYQLVAGGVVLAQSDRLRADQPLRSMNLVPNAAEIIAPGEYEAVFWCIFYGEDGGMETNAGEEILLSILK